MCLRFPCCIYVDLLLALPMSTSNISRTKRSSIPAAGAWFHCELLFLAYLAVVSAMRTCQKGSYGFKTSYKIASRDGICMFEICDRSVELEKLHLPSARCINCRPRALILLTHDVWGAGKPMDQGGFAANENPFSIMYPGKIDQRGVYTVSGSHTFRTERLE
jgi:hypothetical protein